MDDLLAKSRTVHSERDVREVIRQVAEALWICHRESIMHRDLKPEV